MSTSETTPDPSATIPGDPAASSPTLGSSRRIRGRLARRWRDYEWAHATKMIGVHVLGVGGAIAGVVIGAPTSVWICAIVLYVVRMFFVTAAYHRYFSHRTFKTSRAMQLVLAFGAMSSAERGVLWWAAHHRAHHRHSDTEQDVHSPLRSGLLYSHLGWFFDGNGHTDLARIKDFARYPELRWLDRYWLVPPTVVGLIVLFTLGWWGWLIGFLFSTVLVWHGTFFINSLAHVWGTRRYATPDGSRNSWVLALIAMGEGWHNNHHHCMSSCRQGFFWWELDLTYLVLRLMSAVGLVWDLKEPPRRIYEAGPRPQPGAETLPPELTRPR